MKWLWLLTRGSKKRFERENSIRINGSNGGLRNIIVGCQLITSKCVHSLSSSSSEVICVITFEMRPGTKYAWITQNM